MTTSISLSVMASRIAAGGYFVTSGVLTDEAKSFAQGLNLELVAGQKLREMIDSAQQPISPRIENKSRVTHEIFPKDTASSAVILPDAPLCPQCGTAMTKRIARHGSNAGKEFWGCTTYPKCKGILPVASETDVNPAQTLDQCITPQTAAKQKICPQCGGELVLKNFQSGPRTGEQFYGCVPCKKGWPVVQAGL